MHSLVKRVAHRLSNRSSDQSTIDGRSELRLSCIAPAISDRVSVDDRMFEFSTNVVSVSADFLVRQVLLPVQVVNGFNFVKCIKTDEPLQRLLLEGTPFASKKTQQLQATNVFENLKKMKDANFMGRMPAGRRLDYTHRDMNALVLSFPDTVVITAPAVCDVPAMDIEVVLNKPSIATIMKLTSQNLEYLRNAVIMQLIVGGHRARTHIRKAIETGDQVTTNEHNVFWSYSRRKYRAVYNAPGLKRKISTRFTDDWEVAVAFARTGARSDNEAADADEAADKVEAGSIGVEPSSAACGDNL